MLTAGSLVVFTAYAARTYKPLRDLARQSAAVSRAGARADRIAELLASDDALRDRPGAYAGPRARGALELEHVSFAYAHNRRALDDVSLAIEPGERVAVVGPSGAGKGTVARAIAGSSRASPRAARPRRGHRPRKSRPARATVG